MKRYLSLLLAALMVCAVAIPMTAGAAEGTPKVLRYATSSIKGYFNPILSDDVYDNYVCLLMFSPLLSSDEELNVILDENCIAEAYEVSDDHLVYSFKLKEGLKFSDGSPLTASDVAFTFGMMASPEYDGPRDMYVSNLVGYDAYHSGESDVFEGIKVIDDYNVSFLLSEPYAAELSQTFTSDFGILCEEAYAKDTYDEFKAVNATPVGSGPFMLESFEPGQAAILVRNPNWFGKEPKLDGVTMLVIPPETQIMALASGQVDLIQAPAANQDSYDAMEAGGAKIYQFMGLGYNAMMLNHQSPKLADKRVRKALMHGFDRASFIENEYEGFAQLCLTPAYPKFWAYPKDDSVMDRYEYDPELARKMLDEAGWIDPGDGIREKDGVKLELTMYIYTEAPWPEHLVALLKEQWPQIGVGFNVLIADFNTIMTAAYETRDFSTFDMWTQGWSLSTDPDLTDLLGEEAYLQAGGFNPGGYTNEKAWEMFAEARQEFDQEKRAAITQECMVLMNDDLPMLFNAVRDELWGTAPNVTGFEKMGAFYRWADCILDVDIE